MSRKQHDAEAPVRAPVPPVEFGRDAEAIDFSAPDAAAYAAQVEALGRAANVWPTKRLVFGTDRAQCLDVYAPVGARNLPVLLFFHGGAWINGHLGWLQFMAPAVLAVPAVFAAATYRLAPRCRWPAQYEDAEGALRTVRTQIHRLGADPECILLGGHSAGGQLAALLTLRTAPQGVRGCLPVSAPFDLRYGDVPLESSLGRVYRYLFSARSQDAEASPISFAGSGDIPFHIEWGEHDKPHVAASGGAMVATLQRAGAQVTSRIRAGASHFDTHLALEHAADPWYARVREMAA